MITIHAAGQLPLVASLEADVDSEMATNALGLEISGGKATRASNDLLAFPPLSASDRCIRRQGAPPPLELPRRDIGAFGPRSPASVLSCSPGLESGHPGDYSSPLPTSPATLASPSYAGFPSPFAVPRALSSPTRVSHAPETSPAAPQEDLPTAPPERDLHRRKLSSHAARVATEVALSALSFDDDLDEDGDDVLSRARERPSSCDDGSLEAAARAAFGRLALPSDQSGYSSAELIGDGHGSYDALDDQPRRKGRARMSQEKRRRLARRREREAGTIGGTTPEGHFMSLSAPGSATAFPGSRWSPSTSSEQLHHYAGSAHRSPLPVWSSPLGRQSYLGAGFQSPPGSGHLPLGPLDHQLDPRFGPASPALSISSFGSARSPSPFDHAFADARQLSGAHSMRARSPIDVHKPQHTETDHVGPAHRTPGPPHPRPQFVLQPPTPQDAHVLRMSATHTDDQPQARAAELLSSAKRLSQVIVRPDTIVEGREDNIPHAHPPAPPMSGFSLLS